ncbi:hypothetical protein ACN28G_18175 [Micromonospora sp. WMMA1923]|uniref:Uncharacterized protein n=1 Tax=Micromonospora yangpuensis TaxID=683228 RepID=A0A1C6V3S9_9ACTN|nr:hypothetical protein [Micromonospora yangpuensis]SCL60570.1 hypothetical protein GA0070617_4417 [Micromonospora yangpuensis]SCL60596.1 hypothetical protein GA0070617_4424 [Micromonospora yangpuensis]
MASIEEVKAGINQFGQQTQQNVAQLRAVHQSLEQSLSMLRAVTAGTGHPAVGEAIARMEQVRAKLDEASQLAMGAVEATRQYASGF